jgi:hypothetical protein
LPIHYENKQKKEAKMVKKHTFTISLLLVTALGFGIRQFFFIGNHFPLHDGGLFYVMVQDLISNHFVLPAVTSYNHASIPFVYPPFGLYFVGFVETITGADRLQLFRIIPLLVSTLTIPAFYFLGKEILKDNWAALAAAAVFAFLPDGYEWLIIGGGVTRAFGTLFSILALLFVIRFLRSGKWRPAVLGSLFCGLTVLSHPESAWLLFYSIAFFVLLELKNIKLRILIRSLLIVFGTTLIILPWLLTVLPGHAGALGLPLTAGGVSRWDDFVKFLFLHWTGETIFPIFTVFAIMGIFPAVMKKQWFVVFWLPLVFLLQSRGVFQKATFPLALLAGLGISELLRLLTTRFSAPVQIRRITIVACVIFFYAIIDSVFSITGFAKPLSDNSLASFTWIKQETPADARILVISEQPWGNDYYSEWMSALTGRESVSVVQGYEWLPGFSDRLSLYNQLEYEYSQGISDLLVWMDQHDVQADYLVLPKSENVDINNWTSEPSLHRDDALLFKGVKKVFENDDVLVLDLSNVNVHDYVQGK